MYRLLLLVAQAPVAMKSMMQAAWLLTDAFGNLIVVIIATAQFIDSQVKNTKLWLVEIWDVALLVMVQRERECIRYL